MTNGRKICGANKAITPVHFPLTCDHYFDNGCRFCSPEDVGKIMIFTTNPLGTVVKIFTFNKCFISNSFLTLFSPTHSSWPQLAPPWAQPNSLAPSQLFWPYPQILGLNSQIFGPNWPWLATPGPQFATPRPQFATPRPQSATPRPQSATPRPQFATPRPQFATTRPQIA